MRVLGVAAVLVVHTCDMLLFTGPVGRPNWWIANFIDAAGRWAVPIFIMLSGALLLDPSREQTPMQFYRRRLSRLGVAVVFWSAFFMLFAVYYTKWASTGWDTPGSIWKDLLAGAPYVHLHFVIRLGGLYLITPMLRVYVRHASLRLRAQMVIGILGLAVANSIATCWLGTKPSAFVILWPFLGFYLAGNVLREVTVTRKLVAWSCAGFVLCVAGMALGTGWLIPSSQVKPQPYPSLDMMLYDFLSPLRVGMSIFAWFILAYVFGRMSPASRMQRLFKWLAPLTLGIYLVHPLFREPLWIYVYSNYNIPLLRECVFDRPNVWIGLPATVLLIGLASTALTYVIRRIPGLRQIVG
jgi:surface polysaccharide O-acyltransferase-like enzyme